MFLGHCTVENYNSSIYNKLQFCYNKCIKLFFGFNRSYSVTQMLSELNIPTLDSLLSNSSSALAERWNNHLNKLIVNMCTLC